EFTILYNLAWATVGGNVRSNPMLESLRGLAAIVVAGLAALSTYATLGHVHMPVHHVAASRPASTSLEFIAGDLTASNPQLPAPTPPPAAADDSQPAATSQPAASGGAQPAPAVYRPAPPPAPAPPPVVVGSAQQAYINADRAAAGLAPLSWSPCLAGIAAGQSAAMARAG